MPRKMTREEHAAQGVTANWRPEELSHIGLMMAQQGKAHAEAEQVPFIEEMAPPVRMEWTEHYPEETQRFLADPDPNVQSAAQRHFMKD